MKYIPVRIHLLFISYLLLLFSCSQDDQDAMIIYAAAGARLPLEALIRSMEQAEGCSVSCNLASSGILARQIINGGAADLFVSANIEWIEFLQERGYIEEASVVKIASNSLVVVAPAGGSGQCPEFRPDFDPLSVIESRIAIGDPAYVPVGTYTRQVFDTLGWDDALYKQCILGKDVSSVLKYAESGACDWAIVYASEARQSERVKILAEIPDTLHRPVDFYMARIKTVESGNKEAVCNMEALILSKKGRESFISFGFKVDPS